jgi:release factor glutamine methyltransferase
MIIKEAKKNLQQQLSTIYEIGEATSIAKIVIDEITNASTSQRLAQNRVILNSNEIENLHQITNQLLQHKPLQYVLQNAWFYGNKFEVNSSTLIPRPETEELVNYVVNAHKTSESISILDIGTGSGCIAISLKKNLPNSQVVAIDISHEALKIVAKNAQKLDVNIQIQQLNFLDNNSWHLLKMFDVIVSNPPYIQQSEAATMSKNVLNFEPHSALFVEDENALVFYKKIIEFANKNLTTNGTIWVEINEALGNETQHLFQQNEYKTLLLNDLQGKHRFICAIKKV